MSRMSVPLHTLREADEYADSPMALNEFSSPEFENSLLTSGPRSNGYDRVDSYEEEISSSARDKTFLEPQVGAEVSTDSLGIYSQHKTSSSSLRRKPVASNTSGALSLPCRSSTSTPSASQNCGGSPTALRAESPGSRFSLRAFLKISNLLRNIIPPSRLQKEAKDGQDYTADFLETPDSDLKRHSTSMSSDLDTESGKKVFDDEAFYQKFGEPPSYCWSKKDIYQNKKDWVILSLAIYSTTMSGIWLVFSINKLYFYRTISSEGILPSTASTLAAVTAKSIELSFVAVWVFVLGQLLTRRSCVRKPHCGMTIAEITMRSWIIQPGTIITHFAIVKSAGMKLLGALTLLATVTSMFYTVASDAMVSPKLMTRRTPQRTMVGPVTASYANVAYLKSECPDMFGSNPRLPDNDNACAEVQFSGQSHRNLFSFMSTWAGIKANGSTVDKGLAGRPVGKHSLYENTTMTATWIDTEYANVTVNYEKHGRIINNVTMAMPHPGVYRAATWRKNEFMRPDDLFGLGEYTLSAGVVSPALNVMCVNMDTVELKPLVYTAWPFSITDFTGAGTQLIGQHDWEGDVPPPVTEDGKSNYLNRTVVDEIFHWGPAFDRRPPVFSMYPSDFNMVANSTVQGSDAIYILAKGKTMRNYTLCEMRSWVSPYCSTDFRSSALAGTSMVANCENASNLYAYNLFYPSGQEWPGPSKDWQKVAHVWRTALDINGGYRNNNASNAHELTQLILEKPTLMPDLPSLAEALAVFGGSSIVASAIQSPYRHYWAYQSPQLVQDKNDDFKALLTTQEYSTGHDSDWQSVFYLVLGIVFLFNLACLLYLLLRSGVVTDFTEPQNLFTLAINSPPSTQLKGSCGGGPRDRDLVVPWKVSYAPSAKHYFFEEANERPWRGKYAHEVATTGRPVEDSKSSNYRRLAMGRGWL